jgi:hypothetical protein
MITETSKTTLEQDNNTIPWLIKQRINISFAEYILPRVSNNRPAYVNTELVECIRQFPNWEQHLTIVFNNEPIPSNAALPDTKEVYAVWLRTDYLKSQLGKDYTKTQVQIKQEASLARAKELQVKLHNQLNKVRIALTNKGATPAVINKLLHLALKPWEAAIVDGEQVVKGDYNDTQKELVAKAFGYREKFGLKSILDEIERMENESLNS